ncbi:hypothetical protein Y032_0109g111 [Ancylostoma ceylanicum]|uniref:BZIP domain-containing protein n=1 Tax=Ancylostoma ceylanicum TaxID=53326 RepID=A0A016TEQ4_9BILA|nr:hypothetical protein Y032_0109g111 [Ancylostoma ceylanicum]
MGVKMTCSYLFSIGRSTALASRSHRLPDKELNFEVNNPAYTEIVLAVVKDPRSQGLVQLSAEEKRTLVQEGYPVPTRLPLSKAEEESLKIVRRKIKNKLSAQESRRKRKEYMDTLESRCQAYFNENTQLKNRVRQLEMSNQKLVMQVKKLQDMVATTPSHSDVAANH